MVQAGWIRRTLVALLALISINAVVAGSLFVADPDGSTIGIPQDWLEDTPFATYLVPGVLLVGLGILHGAAAFLEWRATPKAWFWAGLSGSGLLVWILVQAVLMGSTRHPMQTILQVACAAIGVATGLLALTQIPRPLGPASPAPPPLLLVADDASFSMQHVEAFAARLATKTGAAIHVVLVGTTSRPGADAENEAMFGRAVDDVDESAARIRERFRRLGVEATVHVQRGQVAEAICQAEQALSADVLVLGSRDLHVEFAGYGSVLDHVKNQVGSSVLVVRGPVESIAVAIDGSEPSLAAAKAGGAWAVALDLPLTLLRGPGAERPPGLPVSTSVDVVGEAGAFLEGWSRDHPAALLVVGARGLGNPGLLRMGSISDRLSWAAASSVLVVRTRATRP